MTEEKKNLSDTHASQSWTEPNQLLDEKIRPHRLDAFIGHPKIHEKLSIFMQAAKQRGEALGHCLFHGPPGLGKTTLAHIISQEMGTHLVCTSGPVIEKAGDLAGILTNLEEGDVLFIDEIHRLQKTIEEYLYPAIEDFSLDIVLDAGTNSRSVRVDLQPFTLIGATTRIGLLTAPMRSRFHLNCRLNYYAPSDLAKIIKRSSHILQVKIDDEGALEIARRSRGTPRVANNLLRWVRDYAQIENGGSIRRENAKRALDILSIDERGLDEIDKKMLRVIIDHHKGGPVGINTLAASLGEEASTLEEVYEPYLIMEGFLRRTPRGREVTDLAMTHLNNSSL